MSNTVGRGRSDLATARPSAVSKPWARRADTSEESPRPRRRSALRDEGLAVSRRIALGLGLVSSLGLYPSFAVASDGAIAAASPSDKKLRSQTMEERAAIKAALDQVSKGKSPVLLRLVFHDAGTYDKTTGQGGSNGSIRFELDRPESRGLKRGLNVVKEVREKILSQSKIDLSFADLIVICGAWAVRTCGGPDIEVQVGRTDTAVADRENMIPDENLPVEGIKASFEKMGLDTLDLVALSGSHAIGGKGFGDPLTFDNVYYKTLLEKPWLSEDAMKQMIGIPSDRVLADDPECKTIIQDFARDQNKFFESFAASYIRLTSFGYTLSG